MAARYGRLISISRFLPRMCSGSLYRASASGSCVSELSVILPLQISATINGRIGERYFQIQRYSVPAEVINNSTSEVDILSSIQSAFDSNEGPNHCWINKVEGNIDIHQRNGAILVLVGQFLEDSSPTGHGSHVNLLTELKSIQHRYPELYVIGVQPDITGQLMDYRNHLAQLMVEEYVSFPILLTSKDFFKASSLPFYILFKDFKNPLYFHGEELDHEIITKAFQDINNENEKVESPKLFDFRWVLKQNEASKEPYLSSAVQNLLLFSLGGLSADEDGDRVFLSDSYHHRIIISNSNGKILDCIGSSPGFEDGAFESSKLFCPASTFYHAADNCLYIVDAENHAIRRADMERRIIETIYPRDYTHKKGNTIWTWITNIFARQSNVEASKTLDDQTIMFPWHMMQSTDNKVLIVDRSFERSWVLDLASGEIKEIIEGYSETMEVCQELIVEKLPLLEKVPRDWFQEQIPKDSPDEAFVYKRLISSITTLGEHIFICDTVGHRMLRINKNSGVSTNFELSNFGVLGLPYWLARPLENVYAIADGRWRAKIDHLQHFCLLPGRVNIHLNVDIPIDTELVEPLQESGIWRQARGSATEVLESEGVVGSTDKVGISQKFYDELDNLPYAVAESDEESIIEDDNDNPRPTIENEKVHIYCAVNTSPGTSEVIIYAALYLKLQSNLDIQDSHEHYAGRLADLLVPESSGELGRDLCYQILRKSGKHLKDFVFVKPLHVRIKLECSSHPKADNTKDIILTDTSLEVNVSL